MLGGNPTLSDVSILLTSSYVTNGGTTYLVYSFYMVTNLGSATFSVESSTDLSTWTAAVNGTNGVTITTTAYNAAYNATTVTIPDAAGSGRVFARLRATLPSSYTGTISGSSNTKKMRSTNGSVAAVKTRSAGSCRRFRRRVALVAVEQETPSSNLAGFNP